jgi:hypothetical protein
MPLHPQDNRQPGIVDFMPIRGTANDVAFRSNALSAVTLKTALHGSGGEASRDVRKRRDVLMMTVSEHGEEGDDSPGE